MYLIIDKKQKRHYNTREGGEKLRFNLNVPKWSYDFKMWMLTHGLTAEDISNHADVGITTVYNIMSGKHIPHNGVCEKIQKATGYDLKAGLLKCGIDISKPRKRGK